MTTQILLKPSKMLLVQLPHCFHERGAGARD